MLMKWKEMVDRYDCLLEICFIVFVGKYMKFLDFYVFVIKVLEYFVLVINYKLEIKYIDFVDLEFIIL